MMCATADGEAILFLITGSGTVALIRLECKRKTASIIITDISTFVPRNHLLRKINELVDFNFIYEKMSPYYSKTGHPSVDPVCMIKMLIIGYLYGIKSERRLEEEVTFNLAYRYCKAISLNQQPCEDN